MNKRALLDKLIEHLQSDLETLKDAAIATYEAATGEESRAENEYDTRGLEASYLAGAQAERVRDIEEQLHIYRHLKINSFDENTPIGSTALVETLLDGKKSWVFILPKGGGTQISFESRNVQVVTPNSPLGEALVGLSQGDLAIVESGKHTKEYEILTVE